jgi:hypothetical protein
MIRRLIPKFGARAAERLVAAAAARRAIHGIDVWVLNDGEHATDEALFDQAAAALELVHRHQPWRLRAMRRDFARIFIRRNDGCRALFDGDCVLDSFFVATFRPAQVASSIVHEGVHARFRRGGRVPPRDLIAWEERQCRRAELAFGLKAGDAAVVERARASLALSDPEIAPLADPATLRARRL